MLRYKPRSSGWSDQPLDHQLLDLERLEAEGLLRVLHHGGERGYHLKLILNDREAVSLFVWNNKVFKCMNTLARSYGLIPIEKTHPDPDRGDRVVAEGRYRLHRGILEINVEKTYDESVVSRSCSCRYKLKLKGVREYESPKHGYSVRPEYLLICLGDG